MGRRHVLVTGASGFVGTHILARAAERGVDALSAGGDLRVAEVCRSEVARARPGAVIHAASVRPGASRGVWEALGDNLQMIGNLVGSLEELAPDAPLLVLGSAAQYGLAAADPLLEDAPQRPVTPYGVMKTVLEAAATARPLSARVRVIWARTFNHLGPGQPPEAPVAGWARQVAEAEREGGGMLRTGRLDVVRDFLDVRDVADAYLALVESSVEGPVNVCSGEGRPLRDVVEGLIALSAAEVRVEEDPSLLREQDPPVVVGDPARLRERTGWRPRWRFEDSLRAVLEEWRGRRLPREATVASARG